MLLDPCDKRIRFIYEHVHLQIQMMYLKEGIIKFSVLMTFYLSSERSKGMNQIFKWAIRLWDTNKSSISRQKT